MLKLNNFNLGQFFLSNTKMSSTFKSLIVWLFFAFDSAYTNKTVANTVSKHFMCMEIL